ncbi:2-amino-4-hydroxy-6-hydroxymethyldihydropteridine pyrophosphokinase [wastewater metagenome]|uniref:2-amino-4-hydroxy-6-hydroxymethyldihydropteridine diphosphokinase n=2 Tax=unclassified sequences TaxID=12908 RepID=A0A5B8RDB5_9ZZZZ|nr:2-amino-4-hydroxy-6-hydroxymethyldihydropteridine diphosphokinase [Arhodomonas aquaeolei]MCS4505175.1 2-amino-4-hydroxy-6-hydroxymethyldihydropteridine diphosphokinase [Arhodomonas aquaeolei]QEA05442.1 2-amino-4-hydroxy-6-hydroxymethyldihydropteridine pyrophosphokinase [uncultured organism]
MRSSLPAWVAVGSNIGGPVTQVRQAMAALEALPETRLEACSSLYRNPPMGPQDQPDFVNAVVRLRTSLEPLALLDALQAIERAQGRVRHRRWGERTLDLDLVLYGEQRIDHPRLVVPHPGIGERAFVLRPLQEIDPGLDVPGQGVVDALLARVDDAALQRVN